MLAATIFTLKNAIEVAVLIIVLCSLIQARKESNTGQKNVRYAMGGAILTGVLLAYVVKVYVDREIADVILRSLSVGATLILLGITWLYSKTWKNAFIGIIAFFFTLIPSVEISYYFISLVIRNKGFLNTDLLLRFAGGGLALIIAYYFFRYALVLGSKLSFSYIRLWGSLILVLYLIRQFIGVFHMLFVLGFIPPSKFAVSIIALFINTWQPMFFYFFILIITCWMGQVAYGLPRGTENEYQNPAQQRKVLSAIVKSRRQIKGFALIVSCMIGLIAINYYMENRTVTLSPAVPVEAKDGYINIPRDELEDGQLHRYGFVTPNDVEMRFIIIKKGEGVYGVGLDACEICGTVGYYQRKDQVICLNCDVIISIPTIGFPGGCNPIPFDHEVKEDMVVINETVMLEMEEQFK